MDLQPCQASHSSATPVSAIAATKSHVIQIRFRLQQLWQSLTHALANDEPRVWQRMNRQGQITSWHIYDPRSGYTVQLGSEMEVRLWLEHRFYQ